MLDVYQINFKKNNEAKRRYIEVDTLEEVFEKSVAILEEEGFNREELGQQDSIFIKAMHTRKRYRINQDCSALVAQEQQIS